MTSSNDECLQHLQRPHRGGYGALAVATGYAGMAWFLKDDPGAAVMMFQAVLITLGRRGGRK
ncbi:hypothetical protein BN970_06895 [Mycolicibacterium conceptionense]|uniref:Uncharacterized protein n=1 Tax=Mycolicibacterium conceptionense TaxID=451644 RepID=A0A0U1DYN6_9MYCO|nr:hypothetical protein AWB98_27010 [Mycolicibacterium conceptionense]CQD25097.1 hypothetical protein BN970_06895 [Mycolicibacterium conceptionense]